ncbi:MAG: hypothetical protein LAT53_01965 [Idiomarina sp.]|nr:hypothetical protein [Idiomarina sp.]
MSKLDKDQVLADFTKAYKNAHGKAPKLNDSNGWFSVDGGKNMRLAQLAELTDELNGGKSATAKKTAKASADKKAPAKKAASAKPAAKKPAAKKPAKAAAAVKKGKGGLTAKELWKQQLEASGHARLPRGMR